MENYLILKDSLINQVVYEWHIHDKQTVISAHFLDDYNEYWYDKACLHGL